MKVEQSVEEREVVNTVQENVVTLTLTEEEAAILAAIVSRINGNDSESKHNPRKNLTSQLYTELHRLGYASARNETYCIYREVLGSGVYGFSRNY